MTRKFSAFLGSCLLVGAALMPHAPARDVLLGFALAAGVLAFTWR